MKHTSIVAPLLLIGLGALFLFRNLNPDLPVMPYLARYWPFLLIGWGVLRLAELLFWAATSKPLPARGISGGEWVLVLFICIFGASLHAAIGFSSWWPRSGFALGGLDMLGERFEYPISAEKPCSRTPRIVIEDFRGNAHITGTDADEVKVTGHETVRSFTEEGANRANHDSPFELAGDASQVVLRTNQSQLGYPRTEDDLEITVPKGAAIEAHGRGGDFELTHIGGGVRITPENASVQLSDIHGGTRLDLRRSSVVHAANVEGVLELKGRGTDIDLENVAGPVTIEGAYTGVMQFQNLGGALHFSGPQTDLNVEKRPGQLRMVLGNFSGTNMVGPVHLSARSRDVQISGFTNALELQIERGDIDLRPGELPLARMDVHTHSGDVTLTLPPAAKFDLNASTKSGEINNDFGVPLNLDHSRRGATLRGSTGGGPAVSIETDRGRITIRKASEESPLHKIEQ
jgi:DUF4097 and DUF4098 domain-containing protein YvlB